MFPLLVGSGLAGKAGVDMCENQDRIKVTHPPQAAFNMHVDVHPSFYHF